MPTTATPQTHPARTDIPLPDGVRDLIDRLDATLPELDAESGYRTLSQPIDLAGLDRFARVDPDAYTRVVPHRTDGYELLLICWKPGQRSPIHDHGDSDCGFRVVRGPVFEARYTVRAGEPTKLGQNLHEEGSCVRAGPGEWHKLGNTDEADGNVMTLHLYAPPLRCVLYENILPGT